MQAAWHFNGDVMTCLLLKCMYGACTETDWASVHKRSSVWEAACSLTMQAEI